MSANDYYIACRIDALCARRDGESPDPNHGCWEVVNQRTATRIAGPFDRPADARALADELNGAVWLAGRAVAGAGGVRA